MVVVQEHLGDGLKTSGIGGLQPHSTRAKRGNGRFSHTDRNSCFNHSRHAFASRDILQRLTRKNSVQVQRQSGQCVKGPVVLLEKLALREILNEAFVSVVSVFG